MKEMSPRTRARCVAALGIVAVALCASGAPRAAAKRAPEVAGKRATKPNALRPIEMKQDAPGAAFARQWDQFRRGVGDKRAAGAAPLYGDSDVFARFSALTGAPRVVYGDLGEAPAAAKRADRAMLWLETNAHVFGVDTSQITLARAFEAADAPGHYYYDQQYEGLPVFYGEVAVHVGRDGHVWGVTSSYTPVRIASTRAAVAPDAAYDAALRAAGVAPSAVIAEAPSERTLGVWPTADGGRLAYRVTFSSRAPAGLFETFVDATTGEVLADPVNRMDMVDGTGKVFIPNPVVSEGNNTLSDGTVIVEADYLPATLFGLNGSGKLVGPYSQVHPNMTNPAVRANNDFSDLRRTTNQFDEEEVYWAIDQAETAFQNLGYTAANGRPIMNYSIKVYAHNSPTWGNQDNSSFSGSNVDGTGTGILEFGTGGVDDASDAEIIWHEYGHATLWNQRPGISQNVSREGIGEGWGDYLAGTMSKREPGSWTYNVTVGEWDATSYNPGNPPYLRRLDNPTLWANRPTEVHDAGEVWSHPLFDYDQQVGQDVGLHVALEANFLFDLSPTQAEGAAAMVTAEQTLFGGATAGQLKNAFYERGTLVGTVHPVVHTIGVGVPGTFFLRNSAMSGVADLTVSFGGAAPLTQIVGDWNGNGSDTVGLYNPADGFFFLRNSNTPGLAETTFQYGSGGAGLVPVVGDWDGNGSETVGLYNPADGFFFLRNSNSSGPADVVFKFGPGGADFVPVVGDWDGNGTDTVGIYSVSTGTFFLKNSNAGGGADATFIYGTGGVNIKPISGDWNGDGVDTVGIYDSATGRFYLKNANASGAADVTFNYGAPGQTPLVGDWNGGMHPYNPFGE